MGRRFCIVAVLWPDLHSATGTGIVKIGTRRDLPAASRGSAIRADSCSPMRWSVINAHVRGLSPPQNKKIGVSAVGGSVGCTNI